MRHLPAMLAVSVFPLWAFCACAQLTEPAGGTGPAPQPSPEPVAPPTPTPAAPTPAPTAARPPAGESIRVAHVLVAYAGAMRAGPNVTRTKDAAKKRAEKLVVRSKKGEDFAALAKETSDDSNAQRNGGDLGAITRDSGFTKPFVDAAFELKAGEISSAVETEFGFHIIRRMP